MFEKDPCLVISSSAHSPHSIIPEYIKPFTQILDVGCNTGYLGKLLKQKKVITDGIDINEKALKVADKYYRKTFKRDLYLGQLSIPNRKYDYITFIDVLEHLPRPDLVLRDSLKFLNKQGRVIISLPNIARLEIRIGLLFGKFNYTDAGILGEDHLRFFTKKSGIKLIEECGLKVIKVIPTGLGHAFGFFDTMTAFQFIFICSKT